jgi:Bacteriophage minor capsid protein
MMLTELANYLDSLNVAKMGQNLFTGTRPEEPDEVLTLHEYPGQAPEYQNDGAFAGGPARERPQVQVMGRGKDYESVRAMVQAAWVALAKVTNTRLSGVWYQEIRPSSSPALIGRDGNDRVLIGFNASVVKEV